MELIGLGLAILATVIAIGALIAYYVWNWYTKPPAPPPPKPEHVDPPEPPPVEPAPAPPPKPPRPEPAPAPKPTPGPAPVSVPEPAPEPVPTPVTESPPVEPPVKEPEYLGNANTLEIHDLSNLQPACQIDRMKEENKVFFNDLDEVKNAIDNGGYNGCRWCLTRYHTD